MKKSKIISLALPDFTLIVSSRPASRSSTAPSNFIFSHAKTKVSNFESGRENTLIADLPLYYDHGHY